MMGTSVSNFFCFVLLFELFAPVKNLSPRQKNSCNIRNLFIRGSCKKFCHWVRITSVLPFIKHIFVTNLQSIPSLLKYSFVTFLPFYPVAKKQINSLLLVSVGDTDK